MSIYVLNGLGKNDSSYETLIQRLGKALNEKDQIKIEKLSAKNIASCQGCFGCWVKTPGICVIDDDGREVASDVINSDIIVFITPVTFGGFSSTLKRATDRLIPNILPHFTKVKGEIHHKPRYNKYPGIIAIGLLEAEDKEAESIFSSLVGRIAINMYAPEHKSFFLYNNASDNELNETIREICMEVV